MPPAFTLSCTHCFFLSFHILRIGRTGRFGRKGLAINFIDGSLSKKSLEVIKQHFGRDIIKLDTNDFDVLEKAIST